MGKGNRIRDARTNLAINEQYSAAKKKSNGTTVGLYATLCVILAILLVAGCVLIGNSTQGIVARHRVIVESTTGDYDMTQSMASYLIFSSVFNQCYQEYYYLYMYEYYGLTGYDTNGILDTYSDYVQYGFNVGYYYSVSDLRNSIETYEDMLKKYVAICDAAAQDKDFQKYMTLTETDKESVTSGWEFIESLYSYDSLFSTATTTSSVTPSDNYSSVKKFAQACIGEGLTEAQVEKASEMQLIYSKYTAYLTYKNEEGVTEQDIDNYMIDNPSDYYEYSYISASVTDEDVSEQLKAATTVEEFKKIAIEYNFEKAFNTMIDARYDATEDADTITALKNKLADYKTNAVTDFEKSSDLTALAGETALTAAEKWDALSDEDQTTIWNNATVFTGMTSTAELDEESEMSENVYSAINSNWSNFEEGGVYTITNYDSLYIGNNLKVKVTNLTSETVTDDEGEETTVYTGDVQYYLVEADDYAAALTNLNQILSLSETTDNPTNDADAGSFEEWASENTVTGTDAKTIEFAREVNDTFVASETEDEVTTYTCYVITVAPALDLTTDAVLKGGYIEYATEADAEAAKATLDGMTGFELYYAFGQLSYTDEDDETVSATTDTDITSSTFNSLDESMKTTFFGDTKPTAGLYIQANDDDTVYYLVLVVNYMETSDRNAMDALLDDDVNDWVDTTAESYALCEEKVLDKIGEKSTETEAETTTTES